MPGRYVTLPDGRVGKFGWKAQQATLAEFTVSACAVEIGLEAPNHPQLADPLHMSTKATGLDLNQSDCDALVEFINHLPTPRREIPANSNRETVLVGEVHFDEVGCTGCHKPRLGDIDGLYSDLLVHNMGAAMSDSAVYYGSPVVAGVDGKISRGTPAEGLEWRTPPLWGVADSAPYLHDGRARTLREAILLHDGEASDSANRFSALANDEQAAVITFLRSLKAPQPKPAPETVTQAATR